MFAFLLQPLVKWIGIGVVVAGLGLTIYIMSLRLNNAHLENAVIKEELNRAIEVNEANQSTIHRMTLDLELANELTEKEIAKSQKRSKELATIRKELRDAKGSNDLMGLYFDDLADRLRVMD